MRAIEVARLASMLSIAGCSGKAAGPDLFGGPDAASDASQTSDSGGGGTTDSAPAPRSAIVIGIRTDLKTPDEVDALHVEVAQGDVTQFTGDFTIATHPLPTSLTLCASDALCNNVVSGFLPPGKLVALDKTAPITITLVGMVGGEAITVRVARLSLVPNRVLALPLTIDSDCVGRVDNQGSGVSSDCPTDQSCVGGACTTIDVDPSSLDDAP